MDGDAKNRREMILLKGGFWNMAHEARTDFAMILGCIFLLLVGGGECSVDARLAAKMNQPNGR